jgi:hypothetical protein
MVLFTDITPATIALLSFMVMGIADLVVPGLGLAGSIIGAFTGRKLRKTQEELNKAQAGLARQQTKLAKQRGGRETSLFDTAQPIIGQLIPQLQALLTGDREALTQRFAPSLQALTSQREGAQERIQQSGAAGSGASVQAGLELEKAAFGERSRLLSSAPAEAQAGLTQMLQLLFGASAQQGAAATSAAGVAGAANQSAIEGTALQQAGNQGFFDALVTGASSFGRSLFQPKGVPNAPSGPLPGGSSQLPFPNPTPMTAGSVGNLVSPRPRKPNQFSGGF